MEHKNCVLKNAGDQTALTDFHYMDNNHERTEQKKTAIFKEITLCCAEERACEGSAGVTCWRSTGLTVGEMLSERLVSMCLVSARGWSMARLGMWVYR